MLWLAPAIAVAAQPHAPGGLFVPVVTATERELGDSLSDSLSEPKTRWLFRGDPGLESMEDRELRSRAVRVDLTRLAAVRDEVSLGGDSRLRLNLFEDVDLGVVIERTAETRYGYSLSGRIDGDSHGSVTLVVHGDVLAGAVHSRQGNFVISLRNGAVHTVRETSGDFECGVDGHAPHSSAYGKTVGSASGATASDGDDGSEVDLLVLFTEAALGVQGGLKPMRASIDLAVAWTNDAYEASGVDIRLNLVAAVPVDYREAKTYGNAGLSNQGEDFFRLIAPTDGFVDEAHLLRDRYAADIVNLIVDQGGGGGTAGLLAPHIEDPSAEAFSVTNNFTSHRIRLLAHELGHVMGLRHDRYTEATYGVYRGADFPLAPYAHGYVNQRAFEAGAPEESRWRTIMAYDWQCVDEGFWCRELPRFSNPNQRFPADTGDPLGVAGEQPTTAVNGPADSVRSLNENRGLVAGFRESATRCDYGLTEERREVPASGGQFSIDVEALSSCEWSAATFGGFLAVDADAAGSGPGRVNFHVEANAGGARVGYVVVAGETLSVYQSSAVAPASVCTRTTPVRDAIVSVMGRDCGAISEFDLLEVTELDVSGKGVTTLDAGDFTGLGSLSSLSLFGNRVETIPDRAFDDLVGLRSLDLAGNRLTSVPRAIRALTSLQVLDLRFNRIENMPDDALAGLSDLVELRLQENRLTAIPDGVFADSRNLWHLDLSRNRISGIRREALRGLYDVSILNLSWNPLGRIPEDLFADIFRIWNVKLEGTQLSAIPPLVFTSGVRFVNLDLSDNRLHDLSGVVFPGSNIAELDLANNALHTLPASVFGEFYSPACRQRQMTLDLSGNPGAPFPLMLELDRVDAGPAAAGPASVVVRVREGAPWPITVRVDAAGGSSFTTEATVLNGDTESEPFEVSADDVTLLGLAERPRVPGSYQGVRIALGDDLRLFALDDRDLGLGGGPLSINLDEAVGKEGTSYTYEAQSGDVTVAAVSVADGSLRVDPRAGGTVTVTVTATDADGTETVRSFDVRVVSRSMAVSYMPPAMDDRRQGFVRVINHSGEAGDVRIEAIDDDGKAYGPVTLSVGANGTHHFNSEDLERGNANKGLSGGVGPGQGGWRLGLDSELDIEVLSYIRTADGFLTAMHDVAPNEDGVHRVAIFNPGSNVDQVSVLRLINPGDAAASVTIRGIDGDGMTPGSDVSVSVPAGAARSLSAADLEAGTGVTSALGDGVGKWQLLVSSDSPIRVMSLLESPGGHVTNLSTVPVADGGRWSVPLFPSASDELARQGFVRVINHGEARAQVTISAFDRSDRDYQPVTLTVGAGRTVHFNSDDLELGNEAKGLSGSTGAGAGAWRLDLTGGPDIEVLSYIRTGDGFLTSMHEVVAGVANRGRVVTFNPGRNVEQVSRLRLINAGADAAKVTVRAVDDRGRPAVESVRVSVPARSVRSYTAAELESGAPGLEGALGAGAGKWRLTVESDRPITVMSLLESPTGHLTNLSTAPEGR